MGFALGARLPRAPDCRERVVVFGQEPAHVCASFRALAHRRRLVALGALLRFLRSFLGEGLGVLRGGLFQRRGPLARVLLVDGAHELVQSPSFPVRALALGGSEREELGPQFGGLRFVWSRLLRARSRCREQRRRCRGGGELAESSHEFKPAG